ncbi:hypothetical protein P4388_05600 [Bacillus thuringiensis]|nr:MULTISPECIES: hypothetical protein [Bacillus cereus group]MCC6082791.1 hypothetical protein [Bacillus thuringiensis]MCU7663044.1 hypothetical protein [Bacillus thuringiensis]MDM8363475.1 hypothetical protein [Bacillus thuringiensis]MED3348129.1 hypothetical protein [Bacillus thuringiensis]HDX9694189.1 hypothetical protein [Bacillus thuringiensis]
MKKFSLAILTFTCILAFGFNNFTENQQAKQLPKWDTDKQETHADL